MTINPLIILIVVIMVGAIIFLSRKSPVDTDSRKRYLAAMAGYFDSKVEDMDEQGQNFRVPFSVAGRDIAFEDYEDRTIATDVFRQGLLKVKTRSRLTLIFTEKSRAKIRTDIKSIEDLKFGWAQVSSELVLPKGLSEFSVFTNQPGLANLLLADSRIVSLFLAFKSQGDRGHPLMALEIKEGEVVLKFHAPGSNQKPNLWDIQGNATSIERHVHDLLPLAEKIDSLQGEIDKSNPK